MSPRPESPYPVAEHASRIAVVESRLNDLHSKLDAGITQVTASIDGLREQITRQNGRVDGLESWRDRARGAGFVLLLFVPVLTSLLTAILVDLL